MIGHLNGPRILICKYPRLKSFWGVTAVVFRQSWQSYPYKFELLTCVKVGVVISSMYYDICIRKCGLYVMVRVTERRTHLSAKYLEILNAFSLPFAVLVHWP